MTCRNGSSRGPRRFEGLEERLVLGRLVPVAAGPVPRLLGLAHLGRDRAGAGLLLERCNSVHTFGMRFPLDVFFLDRAGAVIRVELGVGPRRMLCERRAVAVFEVPSLSRVAAGRSAPPTRESAPWS